MSLDLITTEDLRLRLWGLFDEAGPFQGRDLSVGSGRIRLGETSVSRGSLGLSAGLGGPRAPRPSYQGLFFDTVSGSVPAGEQEFNFELDGIPFVGAITEVDVIAEPPIGLWQMKLELEGEGTIFRVRQDDEVLPGAGWFRPTPPGFWPETEGITFPVSSSGRRPIISVRRPDDAQPNLILRVFIVAHPS